MDTPEQYSLKARHCSSVASLYVSRKLSCGWFSGVDILSPFTNFLAPPFCEHGKTLGALLGDASQFSQLLKPERYIVPAKLTAEGKIFSCPIQEVVSGVNLDIYSRVVKFSDFIPRLRYLYPILRFFNLHYAHEMRKSVPLVVLLHFCSSFDQVTFVFYYYYH